MATTKIKNTFSTGDAPLREVYTTKKQTDTAQPATQAATQTTTPVLQQKTSTKTSSVTTPTSYTPNAQTTYYLGKTYDYEDSEPSAFTSRYDSTINEILNTIKNRGAFDINTDTNYNQLYNNYLESYQTQAQKSMRDSMAQAQLATGGYGSTYSQAAGQQAYDNTMQGMNDQNINLMNLAYSMYADDRANDYNMLSAYQGQDAVDYSRYRDTYNDWYNNRNYYANQYQNAYTNDYGQYRDTVSDTENLFANALSYASNGYDLPSYLKNQLSAEDQAYFDNIKQTAIANAKKSGSGSGADAAAEDTYYDRLMSIEQGVENLRMKQGTNGKEGNLTNAQKWNYYTQIRNSGYTDDEAADVYKTIGIGTDLLSKFNSYYSKNMTPDFTKAADKF